MASSHISGGIVNEVNGGSGGVPGERPMRARAQERIRSLASSQVISWKPAAASVRRASSGCADEAIRGIDRPRGWEAEWFDRPGHYFLKGEAATRLQNAVELCRQAVLVGDVHGGVLQEHGSDARGSHRQAGAGADDEFDALAEAKPCGEFGTAAAEGGRAIDHSHAQTEFAGERTRRTADAAADIEDARAVCQLRQRDKSSVSPRCRRCGTGRPAPDRAW